MRCCVWMIGSLAVAAALPTTARAYEDQATIGVALGYAGMPESNALARHGLHAALSAGGGFGDAWSLQGVLSHSVYFDDDPLHMSTAGLETVYALDIVRFVPLLGVGLDGLLTVRSRHARGDFALHGLVGFDFLISPRWIFGADARFFWVATNAKSPLGPFLFTAALRMGVRFDLH